jgi:hypothetical protein
MYTYTVPELYLEYTEARRLNLSYEQFSAFVTFYPALLVAHTDGTVDDKEWQFIRALADDLIRYFLPQGHLQGRGQGFAAVVFQ